MINFKKIPEDKNDLYRYLWRIGSAIESGTAGCTWKESAPFINSEWNLDYTSSAYRKPVQYALKFYEHVFSKTDCAEEYLSELRAQRDEVYKIKRQAFDQRREYNKILTREAREEHLYGIISDCAKNMPKFDFGKCCSGNLDFSDNEAILCLSDWHYGMTTNNVWNKYNTEICKDRVSKVIKESSEALMLHKVSKLHILFIGDACHGAIHFGCRVESEEVVCEQLMHVSEIISNLIAILSEYVDSVDVHFTYGNHMRTIQNKEDSTHDDNMEKIIPWYINERLRDNSKIKIVDNDLEDIVMFKCSGKVIFATHGDLDKFEKLGINANMLSTKLFGVPVDYAISGDKHSSKECDVFGVETIQVGSLCGVDSYAHEHRLYSHPSQSLLIFSPECGRKCTYNIKLD